MKILAYLEFYAKRVLIVNCQNIFGFFSCKIQARRYHRYWYGSHSWKLCDSIFFKNESFITKYIIQVKISEGKKSRISVALATFLFVDADSLSFKFVVWQTVQPSDGLGIIDLVLRRHIIQLKRIIRFIYQKIDKNDKINQSEVPRFWWDSIAPLM